MLRHLRGEEHLLLRQYYRAATALILPFVLTLFPYSPRYQVAGPPGRRRRSPTPGSHRT